MWFETESIYCLKFLSTKIQSDNFFFLLFRTQTLIKLQADKLIAFESYEPLQSSSLASNIHMLLKFPQ